MATGMRWMRRPDGSNWGEFGPDDQIGRLNLLTPERRLAAIRECVTGETFCLSLPLDLPGGTAMNPRRPAPRIAPTVRDDGRPMMGFPLSLLDRRHTDVVCDDVATLALQYSTQWDSLAHMGQMFDADGDGVPEPVFYNGFRFGRDVLGPVDYHGDAAGPPPGSGAHAAALGIDRIAETAVQGRGVMIDLQHHLGDAHRAVGYDALMPILQADGVVVEVGDLVCLRTGFDRLVLGMAGAPDAERLRGSSPALDGRDPRLLRWITDSGMAALIADNPAVEFLPARPAAEGEARFASHPLHEHCLFKLGLPLAELWLLSPLADRLRALGRSRFLLTAPPLRLPGAVGAPATPVATL